MLSRRVESLPISTIRKLIPYAIQAKKQGVHIYHLNIGDPDNKTPQVIIQALKNWQASPIRYTPSAGEPIFIEALKEYYHRLGYTFIDKDSIIATIGGIEGVFMSLFSVADSGDEVIVFEPYYSGYLPWSSILDIKLVPVTTDISTGYHLPSRSEIEKKITSKTKAILICTPVNPTGTVYTKEEMEMLVSITKDKGIFLISDEVYREFIFVERKHISVLDYMEVLPDKLILIDSFSKRFSLSGARLGALVTLNKELIRAITKIAYARLSGGFIDQTIGAQMVNVPQSYVKKVKDEYRERKDLIYDTLSKIPGVVIAEPEGAFYTMVSLPVKNSEDFCRWLLTDYRNKNETVMFAPGSGFYLTPGLGESEVRIAYILNKEKLKRSMEILQNALDKYRIKVEV